MADQNGWIKIHRKMLEWEWYSDSNVKAVFLHLLLTANREPKRWQGIEVKRGQVVTGRNKLSKTLNISEQTIRTCINKLKSTNEITIKSTNRFTIITIINFDTYQSTTQPTNQQNDQQANQQLTNNQPTTNQQLTTNKKLRSKEGEEDKNTGKKKTKRKKSSQRENGALCRAVVEYLNQKTGKRYNPSATKTKALIKARESEGFTFGEFKRAIDNKVTTWTGTKWEKFLRPETLFSPKLDGYVNENPASQLMSDKERQSQLAGEIFLAEVEGE